MSKQDDDVERLPVTISKQMIEFIGGSVSTEFADGKRTFVVKINTKLKEIGDGEVKKLLCVRGQREARFEEEIVVRAPVPVNPAPRQEYQFPLADEIDMEEAKHQGPDYDDLSSQSISMLGELPQRRFRALIALPSSAARYQLSIFFRNMNFVTTTARNGHEAYNIVRQDRVYDVIVLAL